MKKDYNRPAFVIPPQGCISNGITELDYFAAKAMNGLLTKYNLSTPEDQSTIAKMSYQLADEMLKERKNYIP